MDLFKNFARLKKFAYLSKNTSLKWDVIGGRWCRKKSIWLTRAVDDEVVSDDGVGVRYADPVPALRTAEDVVQADVGQVWSLTKFYSVDFLPAYIRKAG